MTTTTNPSSIPAEWDRNLSTRTERYAAGKALRSKAPRSSHAEWAPDPERPDPISILEESNKTRLEQLVPSALDACRCQLSRSIEEQQTSWPTTWPRRLFQASRRRSVVMRI